MAGHRGTGDSEFNASGSPVPTRLSNPPGFEIDETGPMLLCPPDIMVPSDSGSCSAVVDPGTPSVADECGVASVVGVRTMSTGAPPDVRVDADAGGCSAEVTFPDPAATELCGGQRLRLRPRRQPHSTTRT